MKTTTTTPITASQVVAGARRRAGHGQVGYASTSTRSIATSVAIASWFAADKPNHRRLKDPPQ